MNGENNGKKFRNQKAIDLINKSISLKDADMRRNNEILKKVLDDVLNAMKEGDEFFREHFQKPEFVGSYYKGTKVDKPEEFDVNLIIKLPVQYESIEFVKAIPGCTKLKLSRDCFTTPKWEKHSKVLSKWVDSDGYLNQDEFRQWMESLFQQTRLPYNPDYELQMRKSGPAFTLNVKSQNVLHQEKLEMNVDLVPVLEFHRDPFIKGQFYVCGWYAVPKPLKSGKNTHHCWRMSFYNHEKNLLKKHGDLKPLIRQVKKMRDKENWKIIPSYHIETLFMHYIRDIEKEPEPSKLSGTERFLRILERLKNVCETQKMMNFWDNSHNLIDANDIQMASIVGRLGKIIKQINKDPVTIAKCVLTKEEISSNEEEFKAIWNSLNPGVSEDQQTSSIPAIHPTINKPLLLLKSGTSLASTSKDTDSAEIMSTLKLILSEIRDVKDKVNSLSHRMTILENMVGPSRNRFDVHNRQSPYAAADESTQQYSEMNQLLNPQAWAN